MKVTIERETCVSCGNCWDSCPGFFEESPDDGFSQVAEKFRTSKAVGEGTPPADQDECVKGAADLCPVTIIKIED